MNDNDFEEKEYEEKEYRVKVEKEKTKDLIDYIAEDLIDQFTFKRFIINDNDLGLYMWDGKRFIKCEEEVKAIIEENYSEEHKITTHIVNEVVDKIKRKTYYKLTEDNDLVIAFDNGIFDWTDLLTDNVYLKSFEEYTKELREGITDIIPFIYIPHELDVALLSKLMEYKDVDIEREKRIIEQIEPDITNVFKQWVNDNWLILYELIGYILYPDYPLHKAFIIYGKTHNGKTQFVTLITDIVGEHNCSYIPLQKLTDIKSRFSVQNLRFKLVNVYDDLPSKMIEDLGRIRMLTGESPLEEEVKFKEDIKFKNYAKLIFTCNKPPKVAKGFVEADATRWIWIDFPNKFEENPDFYETTFTEEKIKRIIAISIWAFYLTLKRRKFSYEAEAIEKWNRLADNVYNFIQTMIEQKVYVKDNEGKIKAETLYNKYTEFCDLKGEEAVDKREFTVSLQRLGITKIHVGYDNQFYYKGIRKAELEETTQNTLG